MHSGKSGIEKIVEASFAQQRLLLIDRLAPGSCTYTVNFGWRMWGALSRMSLNKSLTALVSRHESLRTCFGTKNGCFVQRVFAPEDAFPRHEDLKGSCWQSYVQQEVLQPFDLQKGPLLRAHLLEIGQGEWILFFNAHHLVIDGSSLQVFAQNLSTIYRAHAQGRSLPMPNQSFQYADYSSWERTYQAGKKYAASLEFWKRKLANLPACRIPPDGARKMRWDSPGSTQTMKLSVSAMDQLVLLGKSERMTAYIVLLSVVNILLFKYTRDVAVGTPVAGRYHRGAYDLIGFFVNMLVVRSDLRNCKSYRDVVRTTRSSTLDAFDHQQVPFGHVAQALGIRGKLSPFTHVFFSYEDEDAVSLDLPGLECNRLAEVNTMTAKFDIIFIVRKRNNVHRVIAQYSTELYRDSTIRSLLGDFADIVLRLATNPDHAL